MGYIQPLVENENSTKLQNCVFLTYIRSSLANMTYIINILQNHKTLHFFMETSKMSINTSGETTVELATTMSKTVCFSALI